MTKKELIAILEKAPDDAVIFMNVELAEHTVESCRYNAEWNCVFIDDGSKIVGWK